MAEDFRDPFEVIGKIPEGKSYQWVAIKVLGAELTDPRLFKGWKPVPAKRHPKMPHKKGRIIIGDQLLMERDKALTDAADLKNWDAAREMHRDARHREISPAITAASPEFDPEKLAEVKRRLKQKNGMAYCDVLIGVTISDDEIETAFFLKLDPREYVRRRISMDTEVLLRTSGAAFKTTDGDVVFSRAELSITKVS